MGQKTHPLGFRLVTNQKPRSTWFANFKLYPNLIEEDTKIRKFLATYVKEAGIAKTEINRNGSGNKIEIEIHCARPGILVGHGGTNLNKLYKQIKSIIEPGRTALINIVEIKYPDTEAALIGDFIVEQLEKRVAFRRAIRKAIKRTQVANVPGIKVQVSGRLNGAEIARSEWIREGRVPLQTLRADIDYAKKEAYTIYGILGIKIWLFKGEIL
uniref:Small ribosomal subunit protein uS3c n=1 Tax=Rhizochromulina marina TaxID=1034831 RepID=A0A514CPV8_9STRA|nr:ribosomal protein S3 [Rhizochromulina marina]QDH81835.1 ribosomal protein S3 [Rhizochromulina marina]